LKPLQANIKLDLLALFILLIVSSAAAYAQFEAQDVFESKCALCHTIGSGDIKGPDLIGVNDRRPQEWLIRFIRSSNSMIEEGDPVATELFSKYNQNEMQDWKYSDSEIIELLNYIAGFGSTAATEETVFMDDTEKDSVQVLMEKLDEIIKYYEDKNKGRISKKDINTGEGLFTGKLQFSNHAEACVNCHNIVASDTLNWNPSAYEIALNFDDNFNELMQKSMNLPA